jgi:hypothetical protein
MGRKRRCNYYVVELGPREVYVGSTADKPATRYRKHKAGGPTSAGIVHRRGKRLRPDLARGAKSEGSLMRSLRRKGYRVRGNPCPFRPTRGRKAVSR